MDQLQTVAYYLHTMTCPFIHAVDMADMEDKTKCCFYLEESIEDSWNLPDHKNWIDEAKDFINIAEPHGVENVLKHMHTVNQIINGFKDADIRLVGYLENIINNVKKEE